MVVAGNGDGVMVVTGNGNGEDVRWLVQAGDDY